MKTYLPKIDADKIIDSRDLSRRKDELERLRDALAEIQDRLDQHNTSKPDEDENLEAFEEWDEEKDSIEDELSSAASDFGDDEREELAELETLENEVSEWRDGATLIREDYFTEYAEQMAEDIGAISSDAKWLLNHIDWEGAADELKADYSESTYDGHAYFHRA